MIFDLPCFVGYASHPPGGVPHFDICDSLGSNRVRRKIFAAGTQMKNADSLDVAAFA
jgi:hypothetical protein